PGGVNPTTAFVELIQGPDEAIPLARAALLIAAHAYPDLDVDRELAAIADLAVGCPPGDLDEWHDRVFRELAFTGNTVDYHDPRNSFLNDVVRRRPVRAPRSVACAPTFATLICAAATPKRRNGSCGCDSPCRVRAPTRVST